MRSITTLWISVLVPTPVTNGNDCSPLDVCPSLSSVQCGTITPRALLLEVLESCIHLGSAAPPLLALLLALPSVLTACPSSSRMARFLIPLKFILPRIGSTPPEGAIISPQEDSQLPVQEIAWPGRGQVRIKICCCMDPSRSKILQVLSQGSQKVPQVK